MSSKLKQTRLLLSDSFRNGPEAVAGTVRNSNKAYGPSSLDGKKHRAGHPGTWSEEHSFRGGCLLSLLEGDGRGGGGGENKGRSPQSPLYRTPQALLNLAEAHWQQSKPGTSQRHAALRGEKDGPSATHKKNEPPDCKARVAGSSFQESFKKHKSALASTCFCLLLVPSYPFCTSDLATVEVAASTVRTHRRTQAHRPTCMRRRMIP